MPGPKRPVPVPSMSKDEQTMMDDLLAGARIKVEPVSPLRARRANVDPLIVAPVEPFLGEVKMEKPNRDAPSRRAAAPLKKEALSPLAVPVQLDPSRQSDEDMLDGLDDLCDFC